MQRGEQSEVLLARGMQHDLIVRTGDQYTVEQFGLGRGLRLGGVVDDGEVLAHISRVRA